MIFIDNLGRACKPIVQVRLIGAIVVVRSGQSLGLCGAVQAHLHTAARIPHIGIELHAAFIEPPVLGTMRGGPEVQALLANGGGQLAHDVLLRSHFGGAIVGETAIVHGEAVVMFGDGHYELRAGFAEEFGPLVGVEFGRGKPRNEVFVAECGLRPECLHVVLEGRVVFHVHVARVPLAVERRDRIDAPMNEDAELGVLIPLRRQISLERVPGGAKRPLGDGSVHRLERVRNALLVGFGRRACAVETETGHRRDHEILHIVGYITETVHTFRFVCIALILRRNACLLGVLRQRHVYTMSFESRTCGHRRSFGRAFGRPGEDSIASGRSSLCVKKIATDSSPSHSTCCASPLLMAISSASIRHLPRRWDTPKRSFYPRAFSILCIPTTGKPRLPSCRSWLAVIRWSVLRAGSTAWTVLTNGSCGAALQSWLTAWPLP